MRILLCCLVLGCCVSVASQDNANATAPNRPRRVRISAGVLGVLLEHGVKPTYPEQAIRSKVEGDVILIVQTDETGIVVRTLPVEGDPLLTAASIEALKGFRFRPYLLAGNPISTESQMGFRFALESKGDKVTGVADYFFNVPYRPEFRTGSVTQDGVLILQPRKISGPDPLQLPELLGQSGSVYLMVRIGADGKVVEVKVIAGDDNVVGPVVAAVKQAVFEPQLVDGVPTAATVQESYHLGLHHN